MERRSTAEGGRAMPASDLDDVSGGGGRHRPAFEDTATYEVYGEAWRDQIERNRRTMNAAWHRLQAAAAGISPELREAHLEHVRGRRAASI